MKKKSGGSKSGAPGVLGGIPLQINANDASRLVGGIVEKGFTDGPQSRPLVPPVAPRPSVLPFPVARHRSSGPHWPPTAIDDNDGLDWDADEKEDSEGMELFASTAYPMQRKEKKGLDFNSWKKIAKDDGKSVHHVDEKGRKWSRSAVSHKDAEMDFDHSSSRESELGDAKLGTKLNNLSRVSDVIETTDKSHTSVSHDSREFDGYRHISDANNGLATRLPHNNISRVGEHGGDASSLESEIDADNRARLAKMSSTEIAEAQAELMAKLSPELINALKKRGHSKTKRPKFALSGASPSQTDGTEHEDKTTSDHAGGKMKDVTNIISPGASPEIQSMWDTWSKRVEDVRHLRFSLDGNIVSGSAQGSGFEDVTERDFIRTEGDPAAIGYTIKEALALTRSVVPGQRSLALHLIASILDRAICCISRNSVTSDSNVTHLEDSIDGEAIWAYCLGPEPELALSLRLCLDDNHNSVVLACAKAIQHALSSNTNDAIFDILERTQSVGNNTCTAPVFRSKADPNLGFLRGGFWKYNTKPANILPLEVGSMGGEHESESEPTIQDDIVVALQDFAAGLVRMGILQRINHLLETDPAAQLEECLISILIAIARHSPRCAAAVMGSGHLVQTVARRFTSTGKLEINACKIKSVVLIKVLAQVEKNNCLIFLKNGIFHQVTWQLYKHPPSLDQWMKSGTMTCKLFSDLMVEQLRLWKVFIHYGFCISDFPILFPSLCTWLTVPTVEKMVDTDMNAYYAITREAYLLLDVLACKLPSFYSQKHEMSQYADEDNSTWSWGHVGPIIDLALEWIKMKSISDLLGSLNFHSAGVADLPDSLANSIIWVISSVLCMISSVLKALIRDGAAQFPNSRLPWLPEFVPKIGLTIARNELLNFSGGYDAIQSEQPSHTDSILHYFYQSRFGGRIGLSLSSTCCLQGLVQVAASIDKIVQNANLKIHIEDNKPNMEDKILASGILKSFPGEIRYLLINLMKLVDTDWHLLRDVENFGRGGPSPGVGIGWGTSGGGYWSVNNLLAQQDVQLLSYMLEVHEFHFVEDPLESAETNPMLQLLSGALKSCLIVSPGNSSVADTLLKFICQAPILKYLAIGIHRFLISKGHDPFQWNYEEDEYDKMTNVLVSHFTKRWLGVKKRKTAGDVNKKSVKKGNLSLPTIYESMDLAEISDSLTVVWASRRLPLPTHWFLSAVASISSESNACGCTNGKQEYALSDFQVAKSGLFFLLGLEAIDSFISSEFSSPVKFVPVVWKLHALSVVLLSGMGILSDEKSRDLYVTLQDLYGEFVDDLRLQSGTTLLPFKSEIHENYSKFIETLVEQFAAESYGDILFGRQVAIYLHRSVEASVRLATWNALSDARVLELLPPLDKCFANGEGYLEPVEDNESILEAYGKSWISGALDKAMNRCSLGFLLPLHHLSSFIFGNVADTMLSLRTKLAKSLIRDYAQKPQHEGMLVKLVCYRKCTSSSLPMNEVEERMQLLKECCQGNMEAMEKLEVRVRREMQNS